MKELVSATIIFGMGIIFDVIDHPEDSVFVVGIIVTVIDLFIVVYMNV